MTKLPVKHAEKLMADFRLELKTLNREVKNLKDAKEKLRNAIEAQRVLQTVAKSVQESVHNQIAGVVTKCLRAVFDEPYEFKIVFDKKRGKTEARLVFFRDGEEFDPKVCTEGGVIHVAAFALQLVSIALKRPKRRKLFIADEPFGFVSHRKGYKERVRDLLITLSNELGFQFIIVTHDTELTIGKVIDLGRTPVRKINKSGKVHPV